MAVSAALRGHCKRLYLYDLLVKVVGLTLYEYSERPM